MWKLTEKIEAWELKKRMAWNEDFDRTLANAHALPKENFQMVLQFASDLYCGRVQAADAAKNLCGLTAVAIATGAVCLVGVNLLSLPAWGFAALCIFLFPLNTELQSFFDARREIKNMSEAIEWAKTLDMKKEG